MLFRSPGDVELPAPIIESDEGAFSVTSFLNASLPADGTEELFVQFAPMASRPYSGSVAVGNLNVQL